MYLLCQFWEKNNIYIYSWLELQIEKGVGLEMRRESDHSQKLWSSQNQLKGPFKFHHKSPIQNQNTQKPKTPKAKINKNIFSTLPNPVLSFSPSHTLQPITKPKKKSPTNRFLLFFIQMASTLQSMLSANSCYTFISPRFLNNHQKTKKQSCELFRVRASSDDSDCNDEECAPDKEVFLYYFFFSFWLLRKCGCGKFVIKIVCRFTSFIVSFVFLCFSWESKCNNLMGFGNFCFLAFGYFWIIQRSLDGWDEFRLVISWEFSLKCFRWIFLLWHEIVLELQWWWLNWNFAVLVTAESQSEFWKNKPLLGGIRPNIQGRYQLCCKYCKSWGWCRNSLLIKHVL